MHVESAVAFLLKLDDGVHDSLRIEQLPGLRMSASTKAQLKAFLMRTDKLLRSYVRPMLLSWRVPTDWTHGVAQPSTYWPLVACASV